MTKFEVVNGFEEKNVELPSRGTKASAGYDFYSIEDTVLPPKMEKPYVMGTGIKAEMDQDQVLKIYIRSSIGIKHGITMANGTGIIDSDYYNNEDNEGHIMLPLLNTSNKAFRISKGDRIAQGIFVRYDLTDDDSFDNGEERSGGIGSTGTN